MSKILNSEEEYRTLIESLNVGVYRSSVDPQSRILMANSALASIFGYDSVEDIMRISIAETYLNPEDRNQFILELKQKGSVRNKELRLKKKDGTPFWASCTASIRHNREDNITWVEGIIEDISEQRQIEKEQKRIRAQLQQAEKLESINVLASGMAHDFNSLLTRIMGYIDIAQMDVPPGSELAHPLSEALRACERTKKLIQRLKALTQSTNPLKRTGSITKIVTSAAQNLFSSLNIKPELSFADNMWDVDFDENQIEKVLRNLLTNAVEALVDNDMDGHDEKTGATIKITAENITIQPTDHTSSVSPRGGNYVKITIQDQGAGIPEENMPKIFDPYFSTKEIGVQKGMGLGLAASFSIIKKHDGYIYVDSQERIGTTVSVYLPASSK